MKRYVGIISELGKVSIMNSLEYRADLLVVGIFKMAESATSFIILVFIFRQVDDIAGWNSMEVLLINLTFVISTSLTALFLMPGLKQFAQELNDGLIDKYLVKPVNLQFFASLAKWDGTQIFRIIGAVAATSYMVATRFQGLSLLSILEYILTIFLSVTFFYCFTFTLICSIFFLRRLYNVDYLAAILWDPGKWPTSIFKGAWTIIFLTVVPVGFAATVPVGVLTGRYGVTFVGAGILLAGFFVALSSKVLAMGIRQYSGAGG